jgi:long-subunit fatty acid transport protein
MYSRAVADAVSGKRAAGRRTRITSLGTRLAALFAAAGAAVTAPAPAAASPLDLFGFGGRSPGLAGAGVADATGYDAAYLNPANLADLRRRHVALGYQLGDIDLTIDGGEVPTERPIARVIGAALPLPLRGAAADRVGLALGFVVPPDTLARVQAPLPGQPFHPLVANRAQVVGVQLGVGVALTSRLRLGVGMLALAGLEGFIFVDVDGTGHITTSSEQRLIASYAPIVGASYLAGERLRLGAVARAASAVHYDVKVDNDLASKLPLGLPELRIAGIGQYDPLTVAVEAAWQAAPPVRLFGQLAWQNWSGFPLPTENPLVTGEPQAPPGFHDTVVPRLAVELTGQAGATALFARAGYALVWSPAPEASGRQSFLDNHRHVAAAGGGLAWPDGGLPLHVDLWLQLHLLQGRSHAKDMSLFSADDPPPFERIDTGGHILAAGAVVRVDL